MAAKQGLTAHLSQASEDAKRAVLNRAPTSIKSHSWLSNLNTTCTIKSAPPRTPEVMTMLSTKHGWLVKRNEQHVWQRRWCCVVPHTFLYYFEAEPLEEGMLCHGGDDESVEVNMDARKEGYQPSTTNLSPVGIIDLECYTTINRGSSDDTVLELCGDAITNPDLRSFYFQSDSIEDAEHWTKALLSDRHSALKDEREAYRQVCESFPMQLQQCSDMIDAAEGKAHEAEKECYSVRSNAEESRRKVILLIKEALEHPNPNTDLDNARQTLLADLDAILAAPDPTMNGGAPQAVKLIIEYNNAIKNSHDELSKAHDSLLSRLDRHTHVDKRREEELNAKINHLTAQHQSQIQSKDDTIKDLQAKLAKMQTALDDAHHNIKGQTMEFNMYQNATKGKLSELHQHKKILKKEVIDLRKKIDEMGSETNMLYHKNEHLENSVKNEQQRNEVLEKYVSNMEKQVSVQQNMMEMMSVGAGASVVGRVIGGSSSNLGAANDNNSFCGSACLDPYATPLGTPRGNEVHSNMGTPRGNEVHRMGFAAPPYQHAQAPRSPPRPRIPPSLSISTAPSASNNDTSNQQQQQQLTLDVIDHKPLMNQNSDAAADFYPHTAPPVNEETSLDPISGENNDNDPSSRGNAMEECAAPTDENETNDPQSPVRASRSPDHLQRSPDHLQRSPDHLQRSPDHLQRSPDRYPRSPDRLPPSPDRLQLQLSPGHLNQRSPDRLPQSPDRLQLQLSPGHLNPRSPDRQRDFVSNKNDNDDALVQQQTRESLNLADNGKATTERTMPTNNTNDLSDDIQGKEHDNVVGKTNTNRTVGRTNQASGELTRRRERYQRAMMAASMGATSTSRGVPFQPPDITNKQMTNQGDYNNNADDVDNDDEKSRVSELTEDRTEKHMDRHHDDVNGTDKGTATKEGISGTGAASAANGGLTPTSSSTIPQNNQSYPPRYVLGLGTTEPDHRGGATTTGTGANSIRGDSGKVGKPPKAMTRNPPTSSLPPVMPSPSNYAQHNFAGRGWSNAIPTAHQQQQPNNDEVTVSTMGSFASASQLQQQIPPQQPQQQQQRLSVAQRARIDADAPRSGVNHLRISSSARERNTSSPTKERSTTTTTTASSSGNASESSSSDRNPSPTPSRSSVRSGRGSFFSSIGKTLSGALDNSVLGVSSPPGSPGGSHDDASTSSASAPAITTRAPTTPTFRSRTNGEAGSERPGIERSSSLAERQQQQRERQLAFLKGQGIIKDEASIQGGAGGGGGTPRNGFLRMAGSFTSDAGSVASVGSRGSRGFFGRRGGE